MQISYQVGGSAHSFDTDPGEDLSVLGRAVEKHLRQTHPQLSNREYLIEHIADRLLNALASDATEVQLGDLS